MSVIPVSVTEAQFSEYIEPSLNKAKRGYVCRVELYLIFNAILYKLHTGCQWAKLPMVSLMESVQVTLSWWAVYYHFRKWSIDSFPLFQKMFATARKPSLVPNASLTKTFTPIVLSRSDLSLGKTSFVTCSFVLTAKLFTSLVQRSSPLP